MADKASPTTVEFKANLYVLKDWLILPIPKDESLKLGSRGQISTTGTLNEHVFNAVLEPDGRWSHWVRISDELKMRAGIDDGDEVKVRLTNQAAWPEPTIPDDLKNALRDAPQKVTEKWQDITPMARWEWVRWINATLSRETRAIRIEKTVSKLNGTHRRPCCFNLAACTESYVAKGGKLIGPDNTIIERAS